MKNNSILSGWYAKIAALFLALFITGCSSLKISTDYDPEFNTDPLSTYAIVHKTKEGEDTLGSDRITKAIKDQMQTKGYREAPKNSADFHIDFYTHVQHDVLSNFSFGFGVGHYSKGVGVSAGRSTTPTYDKGTLQISMTDPKSNKIFWQASVSDKIRSFGSPQEREAYIDQTVASMLKEFMHSTKP